MKLTPTQKLHALAYRFYQGAAWTPKAGDYYTTSRADLELYQIVAVEDGIVRTCYTEGSEAISEWPEDGFLTEGFGPRRVYVPEWVMNLRAMGHDHPDAIAVERFADAMKAKLAQKRAEGRGGWEDKEKCTALSLSEMLHDHVREGDPVDVGNFAMMLHQRGESIGPDPVFRALRDEAKGYAVKLLLAARMACPSNDVKAEKWTAGDSLTPDAAWTILCETPDITSPEEYPDHALITMEQLRGFMERAASPTPPAQVEPVGVPEELSGVQDVLDEGSGMWRTCTGCYETFEGYPVGKYPYSKTLKCDLGSGCRECGGIGAIWDTTDYEDFGRYLSEPATPPAQVESVASIVPPHCSGSALSLDPGVLHVSKDGSGYIAIGEDDFQLEDDRCEGPDGPEGDVHWIVRFDASEMTALRDFLNGAPVSSPADLKAENERLRDEITRLSDIIHTEVDSLAGAELDDLEDRATAAEAREKTLREALEPFAALPDASEDGRRFFIQMLVCPEGDDPGTKHYGPAIRRARAVLSRKCKYCGDGVGFDHWEWGFDFCPDCSEIEEERSRKRREWAEYHCEPCPEIELPPYRDDKGRDAI